MHKLLIRQLKKSNIKCNEIDDERWIKLLELVSSMYHDLDEEILAAQHTMKRLDEDMHAVYDKMRGRMSAVAETMPDFIVLINSQCASIELFSLGEQKIFSREEIDVPYMDIHALFDRKYQIDILQEMVQEALKTKKLQVRELEIAGDIIDVSVMATGFTENSEKTLILSMRDVTLQRKAQKNIEYIAHHDGLTGLYNRRYFNMTLEKLKKELPYAQKIAILYLDLNKFKEINDTLGHHAGDFVLKIAADKLLAVKGKEDLLFRLGGDEFVFICYGMETRDQIETFCQNIISAFAQPFVMEEAEYRLSTSIGVAVYPDDGRDFDQLIRHADEAMFFAKTEPGRHYAFFRPNMAEVDEKQPCSV